MPKRRTILWLGILVAVMPFLGFPSAWKTVVYVASGVLIAINSYQLNKHKIIRGKRAERKYKDITGGSFPAMSDGISPKPPTSSFSSHNGSRSPEGEPPIVQ